MRVRHLAMLVSLAIASACGVSVDEHPRTLHLPSTTTTTLSSVRSTGQFEAVLYYVSASELLPVVAELPSRSVETVVNALLEPPSGTPSVKGLGTSIPSGTELLGAQRNGNRLVLDLSESFDNVVGLSRQQAIGQIVLTVTDLPGIDVVRFQVDGKPVNVSSPVHGDAPEVGACDFVSLLAGLEGAIAAGLPVAAMEKLSNRLADLGEACPDPRLRR